MSRTIKVLALLLGCGLLLAACGGHSSKSSSTSAAGGAAMNGVAAVPSAASSAAAGSAGGGSAGADSAAAASAPKAAASAPLLSREVVSTATMSVQTTAVDKAADALSAATTRLGGVIDRDDRSDADTATAELVLRVVPARLGQLMSAADRLGHETARTVTATDVTSSVADVGARVSALQTSVGRLQALMGSSANLNDLISLESQLTQRQATLDSTVAQQRALADQTSLASLTVNLSSPAVLAAKAPAAKRHVTAFGAALRHGANAFSFTVRLVLAGVGYALPFLAALLVLAGLGWWARARRRSSGLAG